MLDHKRELKKKYFEPKFLYPGTQATNHVPIQDRNSSLVTYLTQNKNYKEVFQPNKTENKGKRRHVMQEYKPDEIKEARKLDVNACKILLQGAAIQLHMITFHSLWSPTRVLILWYITFV